jgi:hypothetical protein
MQNNNYPSDGFSLTYLQTESLCGGVEALVQGVRVFSAWNKSSGTKRKQKK